jgi:hypothetical protein
MDTNIKGSPFLEDIPSGNISMRSTEARAGCITIDPGRRSLYIILDIYNTELRP